MFHCGTISLKSVSLQCCKAHSHKNKNKQNTQCIVPSDMGRGRCGFSVHPCVMQLLCSACIIALEGCPPKQLPTKPSSLFLGSSPKAQELRNPKVFFFLRELGTTAGHLHLDGSCREESYDVVCCALPRHGAAQGWPCLCVSHRKNTQGPLIPTRSVRCLCFQQ